MTVILPKSKTATVLLHPKEQLLDLVWVAWSRIGVRIYHRCVPIIKRRTYRYALITVVYLL